MRTYGRRGHATGVYPQGPGGGGGGGSGGVPLSRQRFIDGDTAQTGLTGSVDQPYSTIAEFMAARGNASIADATANFVGWLMPTIDGYTEDVAFPPYASTELRADSLSILAGSGASVTGDVTWANVSGAFAATGAVVSMHNITVIGSITVTDDSGAPDSIFVFGGDEVGPASAIISGGFIASGASKLTSVQLSNCAIISGVDAGTASNSADVVLFDAAITGDISGRNLISTNCSLTVSSITVNASGTAVFTNTAFAAGSNPQLTSFAGAIFDGPSWRSFLEAGGTRASGTAVLVVGGYLAGAVEGAALAAASTSVALNGTGATAGFTGSNSGNHYATASVTPTTVTLLTAGALVGDTMMITRTAVVAANLAVVNGGAGAGTIGTIPTGTKGFVLARFDGTNWVFTSGGSLAA